MNEPMPAGLPTDPTAELIKVRLSTHPVRIVIADDHPMFLYGLKAALAGSSELTVVGKVSGSGLARGVAEQRPSVVLADLEIPGVDGSGAIANPRSIFPDIDVLVLTMHAGDTAVLRAVLTVSAGGTVSGSDVGSL